MMSKEDIGIASFLVGIVTSLLVVLIVLGTFDNSSVSPAEIQKAIELCGDAGLYTVTPTITDIGVRCNNNLKGSIAHEER
jgi:hypothetical protein